MPCDVLPLLYYVCWNGCTCVRPRIPAALSRQLLSRRACCVNACSRRRRVACACALQHVGSRCVRTAFGCAIVAAVVMRQDDVPVKRRRLFVKTPAHDVRVGTANAGARVGGGDGLREARRRGRPPVAEVLASRSVYKSFFWPYRKWCLQRVAARGMPRGLHRACMLCVPPAMTHVPRCCAPGQNTPCRSRA